MTPGRPRLIGLLRNWCYELGLVTGLAVVVLASGYALGAAWLSALAATGLVGLAASLAWPPSRQRLIARAWYMITPHRVRTGCRHAGVHARDGRPPTVLYTTPAAFGERVTLWCQAGITAGDLQASRAGLRAACWARDVRVLADARYAHLVVLEVVRRLPPGPPDQGLPAWPCLDHGGEGDDSDPGEPALYGGLGHHRPFG